MRTYAVVLWSLAGLTVAGSAAYGQSLADIARKEEERRKAVKTPAKVYTVRDVWRVVGGDPAAVLAPPPAVDVSPSAPAQPPDAPSTPPPAAAPPPAQSDVKDEAYWRRVVGEARSRLERSALVVGTLRSQYEALAYRFASLSDASQRALVVVEMEKLQTEIDRLQREVSQQTQDLAGLEEQARRAGVPPGWIRPPGC